MEKEILVNNISRLHTTEFYIARIKKNIRLKDDDVIGFCINVIQDPNSTVIAKGKNYYCENEKVIVTIDADTFIVITINKKKKSKKIKTKKV